MESKITKKIVLGYTEVLLLLLFIKKKYYGESDKGIRQKHRKATSTR